MTKISLYWIGIGLMFAGGAVMVWGAWPSFGAFPDFDAMQRGFEQVVVSTWRSFTFLAGILISLAGTFLAQHQIYNLSK